MRALLIPIAPEQLTSCHCLILNFNPRSPEDVVLLITLYLWPMKMSVRFVRPAVSLVFFFCFIYNRYVIGAGVSS